MRIKLTNETEAKIILVLLLIFFTICYYGAENIFAGYNIRGFPSFEKRSFHQNEKFISPLIKIASVYPEASAHKKTISFQKKEKTEITNCNIDSVEKIVSSKDSLLSSGINKALLFKYSDALIDFEEYQKIDPLNNIVQDYIENCKVILDE